MAVKLMNVFIDKTQNYPFSRLQLVVESLDTQPNEPTNQNSNKIPNVAKPSSKKTLGTSVINSQLSPLSL